MDFDWIRRKDFLSLSLYFTITSSYTQTMTCLVFTHTFHSERWFMFYKDIYDFTGNANGLLLSNMKLSRTCRGIGIFMPSSFYMSWLTAPLSGKQL